jgi:hypothetical protein
MFVDIQKIPVVPLDLQMGAANLRSVPKAIESVLFGDPDVTTYAVIDAAVLSGFDGPDDALGLPSACLFNGGPAEGLSDCAPYLVELHPDHAFTRALFTRSDQVWDHWDRSAVILVQTAAPFDTVRDHFRRFTKVSNEAGNWFFLRFYMPQAMDEIMVGLAHSAPHLKRWFKVGRDHEVSRYIVPRPDLDMLHTYEAKGLLAQDDAPATPYKLDPEYISILQKIRDLRLEKRLLAAITHDYENQYNMTVDQSRVLIHDSVLAARAQGLKTELAIGRFAAAGYLMGQVMTPAHLERVTGYTDRTIHENRRTKALLEFAEAVILQRAKESV